MSGKNCTCVWYQSDWRIEWSRGKNSQWQRSSNGREGNWSLNSWMHTLYGSIPENTQCVSREAKEHCHSAYAMIKFRFHRDTQQAPEVELSWNKGRVWEIFFLHFLELKSRSVDSSGAQSLLLYQITLRDSVLPFSRFAPARLIADSVVHQTAEFIYSPSSQ